MDPPLLCFTRSFVGFNWSESGAFISEKSRPQVWSLKVSFTFSTQPAQTSARRSTLTARLNTLRSLEEEVMTCGFIIEHEGHFCFVEGTGNRRQTALFLPLRNPLLAWLKSVTTSGAPPIRKRKEETVELSRFFSLSSTILNMTLFSAFNLDHAPAAFTKKQKPLWFHFSGNFVLLGKKQTNSTCCLPSSYQGDKLQRDAITFLYKAEQLIEKVVSEKVSRHGLTQKKISSKTLG